MLGDMHSRKKTEMKHEQNYDFQVRETQSNAIV